MARKTHLKLRFYEQKDMSKQGYKAWSRKARPKIHKKVYINVLNIHVPVEEIESKVAIGKFAYDNLWDGSFVMFGYSKGKTATHVKMVMLCKIHLRIDPSGEKYRAGITDNWRLSRYKWFWKK